MKLGLLTAAFPELGLEEIAQWASASGFETLEIACWPAGSDRERRYAGVSHINVETLDEDGGRAVVEMLAGYGLTISALAYYPNNLDPDPGQREQANEHLRKVVDAAPNLGVEIVGTFVGRDRQRSEPDNLTLFREVWPPLVDHAAQQGVKIAIENCPMIFSYDEWPGGNNLAYSPALWRQLFEIVPDANFGLNFDPSHLVWQFIDYERAIYDFADRIFHVHAKDMEVDRNGLYEHGAMSKGIGWQVPRLPGLGEVRWDRFVAALYGVGYDFVLSVEHEDRQFEGTDELVKRGFEIAYRTLRPYVA
jgi:sugar phosphate isomerase/epimerase